MVERVEITCAAADLVQRLRARHGPLLFHQSGGCCDGSALMCYPIDDFRIGSNDILLGEVAGCPVYVGEGSFAFMRDSRLTIDVAPGRGAGFSVETSEGLRFVTRSRRLARTEEESSGLSVADAAADPGLGTGA